MCLPSDPERGTRVRDGHGPSRLRATLLEVAFVEVLPVEGLLGGQLVADAELPDADGPEAGDARPGQAVALEVEVLQPAQVGAVGQDVCPRVGDPAVAEVERPEPPEGARADDL